MLMYTIGSQLVSGDEAFTRAALAARADGTLESVTVPIEPIGLGTPLTIDVREIYTGRHPGWSLFGKDTMLVTSSVKYSTTFAGQPRALNIVRDGVKPRTRPNAMHANTDGTPYIFHAPALTQRALSISVTMIFDKFSQPVLESFGRMFTAAAAVPLFETGAMHLLVAGEAVKLAGSAAESLFDGEPALHASGTIYVDMPGQPLHTNPYLLMMPDDVSSQEPGFTRNWHLKDGKVVHRESGRAYDGEMPYMVLAVMGNKMDDLRDFAPTAASSAMLARFFGNKDEKPVALGPLVDALKLCNAVAQNITSETFRVAQV
jgi:hypothetical protein